MKAFVKIFIIFYLGAGHPASALNLYKHKGLKGKIYLADKTNVIIEVKSKKELLFSDGCPDDVKNFIETLWVTKLGRKSVVHLLKSKSRIYINISDSIGCMVYRGKPNLIYGITDPDFINNPKKKNSKVKKIEPKPIYEYDGELTWESMRINLFKGSLQYGLGDTTSFFQNKIIITDWSDGARVTGASRDSAILKLRQMHFHNDSIDKGLIKDPKQIALRLNDLKYYYHSCREFYFLTGVHEIKHTTSKNIKISRQFLDAEKDPYKAERKAKRKLKKVLKSKRLHYNSCNP